MPRIAVTGASGFIGTVVTRQLRTRRFQVRALTRSPDAGRKLRAAGAEVVSGSLNDGDALRTLVADVDAVVHCAGAVRGRSYDAFARVNIQGTRNLLAAMGVDGTHGGRPLVALSSLAAREPALSDYAHSKHAMESLLTAADTDAPRLMLRPPAVYGPGDRELRPLFKAFERGVALLPAPARVRLSLLYVEDLAAAVVAWLEQTERASGVFEIHDGRTGGYSWDDVICIAQSQLGRRIRKIRLPRLALNGFAHGNAGLSRLLGHAPMLTPGKLRELRHADWVCDNAPLQRILGWQPETGLSSGLEKTCGWRAAP